MPNTGTPHFLRYPQLPDPPNVPLDMKNLADDTHARLDAVAAQFVPNVIRRVDTNVQTSNITGIADTETSIHTLVASLVNGRRYLLRWMGRLHVVNASSDNFQIRLREDSVSGTLLMHGIVVHTLSATGIIHNIEAEYVATATGPKTFFAGAIRVSGSTSTLTCIAAANGPRRFTLDYVAG